MHYFWTLALTASTCSLNMTAQAAEKAGLRGEYFDRLFELTDFPIISDTEKPDVARIDAQINFPDTNAGFAGTTIVDYCYARWTGQIKIEKAGKYTFFTNSDDGSRVFIDGQQIVDNGGAHGATEKSGEVELSAGAHELKVDYFENDQGALCVFSWQGPNIEKQVVPADVLSHEE